LDQLCVASDCSISWTKVKHRFPGVLCHWHQTSIVP
jgi:hypothetical protein